jgi:hypothetical protein
MASAPTLPAVVGPAAWIFGDAKSQLVFLATAGTLERFPLELTVCVAVETCQVSET